MAARLSIGDEAPNFDLTSTENVVLMLRDEVPRMAVVLYFFGNPADEKVRRDLAALAESQDRLAEKRAVILGVSPNQLAELKQVQRELNLRFPLLVDDREFTAAYGVEAPEEGEPEPALFLVDRDQKIRWQANPASSAKASLEEILSVLSRQPSQTYHYPSAVVNRVVDWWINKIRRPRVA